MLLGEPYQTVQSCKFPFGKTDSICPHCMLMCGSASQGT